VADRLIRITTALAVVTVAGAAAIISYQHAYELVTSHGETGLTVRLLPFTVDGLIWAASMVVLRREPSAPPCTTPSRTEPGNWHRGHHRRQPGAHGLNRGLIGKVLWSAHGPPWL
jgi:hypothetical protein